MGHGCGALLRNPLIVVALIPGGVSGVPVVREIFKELQAEVWRSGVEGEDVVVAAVGWYQTGFPE
jgi:hypothetical protein